MNEVWGVWKATGRECSRYLDANTHIQNPQTHTHTPVNYILIVLSAIGASTLISLSKSIFHSTLSNSIHIYKFIHKHARTHKYHLSSVRVTLCCWWFVWTYILSLLINNTVKQKEYFPWSSHATFLYVNDWALATYGGCSEYNGLLCVASL